MNEKVSAYFEGLRGKRIAVLGIGVSNRPLIRMLLDRGLTVLACDKTPREKLDDEVLELERLGATLHVGDGYLDGVQADIVFRTPGMHPDIPALKQLREAGAVVTSEMEAFFAVCPCRIIAVTGSDGKTTTTTLISEILKHAGYTVWLGGNIGTPLLPRAEEMNPGDIAVVELSSKIIFELGFVAPKAGQRQTRRNSPRAFGRQTALMNLLDVYKRQVWNRVSQNRDQGKSTWYFVDEFHLLLRGEVGAWSVEIWKRFRKWGGIPTGITQNIKDLLSSPEIENIFENSDFVYLLNQASGDRKILCERLNISNQQAAHISNAGPGEGLIFFGNVILPFVDHFPQDNELYSIMTTKLGETGKGGAAHE